VRWSVEEDKADNHPGRRIVSMRRKARLGTHPDDVVRMKRTAKRLFGDNSRWSVIEAGV